MTADAVKDAFCIGGAWAPATGRARSTSSTPRPRSRSTRVPAGHRRGRRRAPSPRPRARLPGLGGHARRRARPAARRRGRRARGAHRRDRPAHLHRHGHAAVVQHGACRWQPGARVLRSYAELLATYAFEEADRQLAGRQGADRRRRRDHAVELPAAPDRCKVAAGARRRLHGRAQAVARWRRWRPSRWPRSSTRSGCRPGCSTWSPGVGPVVGEAHRRAPRRRHGVVHRLHARPGAGSGALAAETVKRVALELGGKSAVVILTTPTSARPSRSGWPTASSTPARPARRWTRMLVHRDQYDEVARAGRRGARRSTPSASRPTRAPGIGPLVYAAQHERVVRYIDRGGRGGRHGWSPAAPSGPRARPRLLRAADGLRRRRRRASRDRAGGDLRPGARDHPLRRRGRGRRDRQRHAVRPGRRGVLGGDQERAVAVARRLRTGQVDVNGGRFNPLAPFGGYKQSGIGRELGEYGLEEFLEVKSLQL